MKRNTPGVLGWRWTSQTLFEIVSKFPHGTIEPTAFETRKQKNSPRAWLFALPTRILEGLWILFYGEAKKRDLHFFVLGLFWYIGISTNLVVVRVWDSPKWDPGNLHPTRTRISRWDFSFSFLHFLHETCWDFQDFWIPSLPFKRLVLGLVFSKVDFSSQNRPYYLGFQVIYKHVYRYQAIQSDLFIP